MPTMAEIETIARTIENIRTGAPAVHGALTVIPVLAPAPVEPAWLTLGETGDDVRVTEVDEVGAVPRVKVVNLAGQPLLLLDGEELAGARQNRVLNTTVLVAARSELTVPVSCVEQGRWAYRGRHFEATDASLFASLRRKKAAWVTSSVRAGRGHMSDQSGTWHDLAAKAAEHGVTSRTGAMRDFYQRYEKPMARARQALAPLSGQVGALVFLSGRWTGLELLAGPSLFARAWPRLCAGYVADAIGREPVARPIESPDALLRALASWPVEAVAAVGLGTEYRITGGNVAGAALVADDQIAHLMAFPVGEAA